MITSIDAKNSAWIVSDFYQSVDQNNTSSDARECYVSFVFVTLAANSSRRHCKERISCKMDSSDD